MDRWIMTSALFVIGACYLVTAAGLSEPPGSGLLVDPGHRNRVGTGLPTELPESLPDA